MNLVVIEAATNTYTHLSVGEAGIVVRQSVFSRCLWPDEVESYRKNRREFLVSIGGEESE